MKPRERLITVLEKHEPDCIPIVLQSIISSNVSNELMRITSRSRARDSSSVDGGITFQKVREFSDRIARVNPSNWKKEFEKIANSASRAPIDVNVYARLGVDGFFYPICLGK